VSQIVPRNISESLRDVVASLRKRAQELGLSLMAFDPSGKLGTRPMAGNDFCHFVHQAGMQCATGCHKLARYALERGKSSRAVGPCGCCLLALPVLERRRAIGAIVLGMPTREMLDEEHIARLCDRLQLDNQVMFEAARKACRHPADEAVNIQRVFSWLVWEAQQARDTNIALTSLSTNLATTYEGLSLLYRVSGSMKISEEPRDFLQDICDQLLDVMDVEVATAIIIDDRVDLDGEIMIRAGAEIADPTVLARMSSQQILPQIEATRNVFIDNHCKGIEHMPFGKPLKNLIAVPLIVDEQMIGVLLGLNKRSGDFDTFDTRLANTIANQAAVFLANHHMYEELQELLMGVLHSLTESIDAKDPYTHGHSQRVAAISRRLAEELGFSADHVRHVYLAGLLHDIGKIGVRESILCKDGRLTDEEYGHIKEHPSIGAKILQRIRHLEPIVTGVFSHHERLDGKGYPQGLSGEAVPLEGRIIGLADSWDAMTSHRTYRRAKPIEEAVEELRRCAGTQFDPKLVEIFLSWDLPAYMAELQQLGEADSEFTILDETGPWEVGLSGLSGRAEFFASMETTEPLEDDTSEAPLEDEE
jgi:putative nucleotidyltransferase with HDIG domain